MFKEERGNNYTIGIMWLRGKGVTVKCGRRKEGAKSGRVEM